MLNVKVEQINEQYKITMTTDKGTVFTNTNRKEDITLTILEMVERFGFIMLENRNIENIILQDVDSNKLTMTIGDNLDSDGIQPLFISLSKLDENRIQYLEDISIGLTKEQALQVIDKINEVLANYED